MRLYTPTVAKIFVDIEIYETFADDTVGHRITQLVCSYTSVLLLDKALHTKTISYWVAVQMRAHIA